MTPHRRQIVEIIDQQVTDLHRIRGEIVTLKTLRQHAGLLIGERQQLGTLKVQAKAIEERIEELAYQLQAEPVLAGGVL